jgi:perosamine synthetase
MGADGMNIPLAQPDLTDRECQAVFEVMKSTYLSLGPKLPEFEKSMAAYVGVKHAIAVNSGTSALHLIVRSLGIGPGDEVITTPFSFISSANCILMEGARPVFVDIDPVTYNLDPANIEAAITKRTKAILAVDVFGRCAAWSSIEDIAKRHGLAVIDDSCEAMGSETDGRMAGAFGDAGCFAFYPNKQMTMGEGGVILTNRDDLALACRSMRNQGRDDSQKWLQHQCLGFNYRITDLQCAIGLVQLDRFEEMLKKRSAVVDLYSECFRGLDGLVLPSPPPNGRMSWFVYVIRLSDQFNRFQRDSILDGLKSAGIGCASYFMPIHLQPFYRQRFGYKPGTFPITESISDRTIALPFFNDLSVGQVEDVVATLSKEISKVS